MIKSTFERLKRSALFKDSFWALLGSAMGKGLSLLAGIAVARFLGKEVYGEYGTIRTTLMSIAIVSTFGFGYTATKFVAEYISTKSSKLQSLVRNTLTITLLFSTFLALLQTVFADIISQIIDAPHLKGYLQSFSILIVLNALSTTQIAVLSGFKRFKETARINIYSGVTTFVASVVMTYQWGLGGALGALALSFAFQITLNQRVIKTVLSKYSGNRTVSPAERNSMLKFSIPIALQDSSFTIVHTLSLLILIRLSNYGEVGLSSAAGMWLSVVIFVPAMLKNVMFSYLSSAENHIRLVHKLLIINFISSVTPVSIVLCCSGFISSFYGTSFIGLPKVLNVCVVSAIFISLSEVYCYEFIAQGKPWIVFFSRLIRDALTLIMAYILLLKIHTDQAFWFSVISLVAHGIFLIIIFLIYTFYWSRNISVQEK